MFHLFPHSLQYYFRSGYSSMTGCVLIHMQAIRPALQNLIVFLRKMKEKVSNCRGIQATFAGLIFHGSWLPGLAWPGPIFVRGRYCFQCGHPAWGVCGVCSYWGQRILLGINLLHVTLSTCNWGLPAWGWLVTGAAASNPLVLRGGYLSVAGCILAQAIRPSLQNLRVFLRKMKDKSKQQQRASNHVHRFTLHGSYHSATSVTTSNPLVLTF